MGPNKSKRSRAPCVSVMEEVEFIGEVQSHELKKEVKPDAEALKKGKQSFLAFRNINQRNGLESTMLNIKKEGAIEDIIILSDDEDTSFDNPNKSKRDKAFKSSTPVSVNMPSSSPFCSTLVDDISDQDTLPIATPKGKKLASKTLGVGLHEEETPRTKRARMSDDDDNMVDSSTGETSQGDSSLGTAESDLTRLLFSCSKDQLTILTDVMQKILKGSKTEQTFLDKNGPSNSETNKPKLVNTAVQVEMPNPEHLKRVVELESLVDQQKRSLEERDREVNELKNNFTQTKEAHGRLLGEKEKEIEGLKDDFVKKENEHRRLLAGKAQELENLKEKLTQKEIELVAASSLLGLSFDQIVRKNTEAQIAKTALSQQSAEHIREPVQTQPTAQTCLCPTRKDDLGERLVLTTASQSNQNSEVQPSTSNGIRNVPCKGEFTRRTSRSVNGVYVDAFPLHQEVLEHFASCSNAPEFVRSLMLHCYTKEYLESFSASRMDSSQVEQITDATLAHFNLYRTRKDTTPQTLNRPTVRKFISNVLKSKQSKKKTAPSYD